MKLINKFLTICFALVLISTSCTKDNALPFNQSGTTPTLSINSNNIVLNVADSNKVVASFSWTDPGYSTITSNIKYVLEIDRAGKGFTKPVSFQVVGSRLLEMKGIDLNNLILNNFLLDFNVPYSFDARLKSSHLNNNELKTTPTITFSATAYKVPPKVALPANGRLFIVGDLNGWNNNPGLDAKYEFSRISETKFEGIFQFTSNNNFKLIQELGVWGSQYHMIAGGTSTEGFFEQKDADPAFNIGANGGWFRVIVDFQKGTYKIEPAPERVAMPADLYLVGSINGWNNSATLDSKYKFTNVQGSPFQYSLLVDVPTGGGNFKLIQNLGNWGTQFRKFSGDATMGEMEQKDADPAFDLPQTAGMYKMVCDFATNKYWITKQ